MVTVKIRKLLLIAGGIYLVVRGFHMLYPARPVDYITAVLCFITARLIAYFTVS